MTQSAEHIYKKYIQMANKHKECPVCERAFGDEKELGEFIKNVRSESSQTLTD